MAESNVLVDVKALLVSMLKPPPRESLMKYSEFNSTARY